MQSAVINSKLHMELIKKEALFNKRAMDPGVEGYKFSNRANDKKSYAVS